MSIDNIDFLHSYTRVFCGDQKRSWHGTTVQVVQPQPTKLHVNECTGNFQSVGESTSDQRCTDKMDGSRQPQSVNAPQQHIPSYRRRKRDVDRSYASPSSKSPVLKICRRARSSKKTSKICTSSAQQISSTYVCIFPNLPRMRHCFLTLKVVPEKKVLISFAMIYILTCG